MGTFNTKKQLDADPSLIPAIALEIESKLSAEGYQVHRMSTPDGGADISLSKGGTFKAVLGMKTALKVRLTPFAGSIDFEASVGIFGEQAIPTIIMLFVAWPVLITQIWGIVKQTKLDDHVLSIADSFIQDHLSVGGDSSTKYCSHCGKPLPENSTFCPFCGSNQ